MYIVLLIDDACVGCTMPVINYNYVVILEQALIIPRRMTAFNFVPINVVDPLDGGVLRINFLLYCCTHLNPFVRNENYSNAGCTF